MPFSILIADDHDELRNALKSTIEARSDWRVCAMARNGREAVQKAIELKPDAVILDFAMPVMDGIAAACEISMAMPGLPILLYTNHLSATLEAEAKKAGIQQVLGKTEPIEHLLTAVEALAREKVRFAAENILASQPPKSRRQSGAS